MSIENLKTFGGWHIYASSRLDNTLPVEDTPLFDPDTTLYRHRLCLGPAEKLLTVLDFLDPFAEADEDTGETKQSQNYIHIRIQRRSARQ